MLYRIRCGFIIIRQQEPDTERKKGTNMDELDFLGRKKNTGRNDPCPCGSGKKYKKCHLFKDEAAYSEELKKQQAELEKANKTAEDSEESADDKKAVKTKHKKINPFQKPKMTKTGKFSNIPRKSAK